MTTLGDAVRISGVVVLSLLLSACGLKKLLPEPEVLSQWDRDHQFPAMAPRDLAYSGPPRVGFPILPFQIFGATYDLDLVLVSNDPRFTMHEYARIRTPSGPLWLAKDALAVDDSQSIVTTVPDVEALWPEIPIQRKNGTLKVDDRSTADRLDIDLSYVNVLGETVAVHAEGAPPHTRQRQRNGSTMGHSRPLLMAVLDLPYRDFLSKASVEIAGKDVGIQRILGLVPFRMALQQTQGGISIGHYRMVEEEGALSTVHRNFEGAERGQRWDRVERDDGLELWQRDPIRDLVYRFVGSGETLELASVSSFQWGEPVPTTVVRLSPPLPDLRRPFEGAVTSRFVVDINGQKSHAVGSITATWVGDAVKLTIVGERPWWVTDRPMSATVTYDGSSRVVVDVSRVPIGDGR